MLEKRYREYEKIFNSIRMIKTLIYLICFIYIPLSCLDNNSYNRNKKKNSKGDKTNHVTKGKNYKKLIELLNRNQSLEEFEIDTVYGFVKSGDFWNNNNKYAVIVSFDEDVVFHILQFNGNSWNQIYSQHNANFNRLYPIISKFDDYNFDGINDLAFHVSTSNGAAIEFYSLWLKIDDSFKYVNSFSEVGTPRIIKEEKSIKSLWACCNFSEIRINKYKWFNNELFINDSCSIENYPNGKKMQQFKLKNSKMELVKEISNVNESYIEKLLLGFQ